MCEIELKRQWAGVTVVVVHAGRLSHYVTLLLYHLLTQTMIIPSKTLFTSTGYKN